MGRTVAVVYGSVVYLLFLGTFLYTIGFVEGAVVSKSIDTGAPGATGTAVLINLLLLSAFALQHSVMARPAFKRRWTRIVPKPVERSTFVLCASAVLALLMWQWRPIPDVVWTVSGAGAIVLTALSRAGWGLVLLSTFLIDHFDLFGLKQVARHFRGREYVPPRFDTPGFYKLVRHPLYLGFILAFWAAPAMSAGHLLFAAVTTAWMLVAIPLEERDLVAHHGAPYREYRERVRMLIPLPRRTAPQPALAAARAEAPAAPEPEPYAPSEPEPYAPREPEPYAPPDFEPSASPEPGPYTPPDPEPGFGSARDGGGPPT